MHIPARVRWEFLVVSSDQRLFTTLTTAVHEFAGIARYAADSVGAMAYISRRKLDGIFVDLRTDGALPLLGTIRRGSSNRFAVVFACAGEHEDASRLLNAGANFVLHKPLDPEEVSSVLESALPLMEAERQRYMRHQLTLPVVLRTSGREQRVMTSNISRGGMAVLALEAFEPGSPVQFALQLPFGQPLEGRGEVAWSNTDGAMGIRFYLMGEEVKKTLWTWMEQRGAAGSSLA
jgi:CheY-like chemotaxis protein